MVAEPSTAIARRRRPRGQHPKRADQALAAKPLPQYLEAHEVNAIIRAADDPRARLLMLEQWRAGLRVSEALALEVADLSLDVELPTIRVRSGKGRKSRIVPVHPELGAAFQMALAPTSTIRADRPSSKILNLRLTGQKAPSHPARYSCSALRILSVILDAVLVFPAYRLIHQLM